MTTKYQYWRYSGYSVGVSDDTQTVSHAMRYWPKTANVIHDKSTAFVVWKQLSPCSSVNESSAILDSSQPSVYKD